MCTALPGNELKVKAKREEKLMSLMSMMSMMSRTEQNRTCLSFLSGLIPYSSIRTEEGRKTMSMAAVATAYDPSRLPSAETQTVHEGGIKPYYVSKINQLKVRVPCHHNTHTQTLTHTHTLS